MCSFIFKESFDTIIYDLARVVFSRSESHGHPDGHPQRDGPATRALRAGGVLRAVGEEADQAAGGPLAEMR